jgi:hypothetical protein
MIESRLAAIRAADPAPDCVRIIGYPEVIHFVVPRAVRNKLEVAAGLEPAKIGFADRRLDHFGIATLYPNLYPKLYPNRPRNAYLPLFESP